MMPEQHHFRADTSTERQTTLGMDLRGAQSGVELLKVSESKGKSRYQWVKEEHRAAGWPLHQLAAIARTLDRSCVGHLTLGLSALHHSAAAEEVRTLLTLTGFANQFRPVGQRKKEKNVSLLSCREVKLFRHGVSAKHTESISFHRFARCSAFSLTSHHAKSWKLLLMNCGDFSTFIYICTDLYFLSDLLFASAGR